MRHEISLNELAAIVDAPTSSLFTGEVVHALREVNASHRARVPLLEQGDAIDSRT
jgi:hypothetical protein